MFSTATLRTFKVGSAGFFVLQGDDPDDAADDVGGIGVASGLTTFVRPSANVSPMFLVGKTGVLRPDPEVGSDDP